MPPSALSMSQYPSGSMMALPRRQDCSILGGGLFKSALHQTSAACALGWLCSGHTCCVLAAMMVRTKAVPTFPAVAMNAKFRWPPSTSGSLRLKPFVKRASTSAKHFVCLFGVRATPAQPGPAATVCPRTSMRRATWSFPAFRGVPKREWTLSKALSQRAAHLAGTVRKKSSI